MSEENPGLLGGLLKALHPDARGAISAILVFAVFICVFSALAYAPGYFKKLATEKSDQQFCWDLREIQGSAVKFNRCTGELALVDLTQKAIESPKSTTVPTKP
jgi:hypothetical protein